MIPPRVGPTRKWVVTETVVPFSCLLGLFLEGSEFQQIQKEQALELPPKPPQSRNWRASTLAPFGGNNTLVLYSCPTNSSSKYFVQVLHNEHPIPMPGCDDTDFCPSEVFKERIVAPHLKHDFNTARNVKQEEACNHHGQILLEVCISADLIGKYYYMENAFLTTQVYGVSFMC